MSRPARSKVKGPKGYDCAATSRGADDEEYEARRLARLDVDDDEVVEGLDENAAEPDVSDFDDFLHQFTTMTGEFQ